MRHWLQGMTKRMRASSHDRLTTKLAYNGTLFTRTLARTSNESEGNYVGLIWGI